MTEFPVILRISPRLFTVIFRLLRCHPKFLCFVRDIIFSLGHVILHKTIKFYIFIIFHGFNQIVIGIINDYLIYHILNAFRYASIKFEPPSNTKSIFLTFFFANAKLCTFKSGNIFFMFFQMQWYMRFE